ncbi:hypothetical protein LXA47_03655 [Massilia sp. P8910]|uniref:hypothetical protein n=1 Tax=Massilia antarctica TaxID=2765360 RepID=UPI001E3A7299|nr:hypothetical protein [Massilia antarctica]MCE3602700.1 hypothetical protein [Massilia antarctica]
MSGPKTLAERLDWMAKNLPGFEDEIQAVREIERRAVVCNRLAPERRSQAHIAVERIKAHVASHCADRLEWWSHPDRVEMRADSNWAVVFTHVKRANAGFR